MNIVFFGSSQFAVPSLKALIANGYEVSCVVTQPDKAKGRGLRLEGTAVKRAAQEAGLRILQPNRANDPEVIRFLKKLIPDLFVTVSYGQILSEEVLNIPKIFAINVHASLLPKYRGAAPINWAIIKGERVTGVTIMKMAKKMDAGPLIMSKEVVIDDEDTVIALENRLSRTAGELLIASLKLIENKAHELIPQDEEKATFAPKLKKTDGCIDWNNQARNIYNLIKGVVSWPGAFTYHKGKLLKIYKASFGNQDSTADLMPGEIIKADKEGITVATKMGNLIIEELQMEGRKRMTVEEFIIGHKIRPGEILGGS